MKRLVVGVLLLSLVFPGTAQAKTPDWSGWKLVNSGTGTPSVTVKASVKGYAQIGLDTTGQFNRFHGSWKIKCRTGFNVSGTFDKAPGAHWVKRQRIPESSRRRYCAVTLYVESAGNNGVNAWIYAK